jgi:hypothetical protein
VGEAERGLWVHSALEGIGVTHVTPDGTWEAQAGWGRIKGWTNVGQKRRTERGGGMNKLGRLLRIPLIRDLFLGGILLRIPVNWRVALLRLSSHSPLPQLSPSKICPNPSLPPSPFLPLCILPNQHPGCPTVSTCTERTFEPLTMSECPNHFPLPPPPNLPMPHSSPMHGMS